MSWIDCRPGVRRSPTSGDSPSQKGVFSGTERGLAGRPLFLTNLTIRQAKVERVFWNGHPTESRHALVFWKIVTASGMFTTGTASMSKKGPQGALAFARVSAESTSTINRPPEPSLRGLADRKPPDRCEHALGDAFLGSAQPLALLLGPREARHHSLGDASAFKLRNRRPNMHLQFSGWMRTRASSMEMAVLTPRDRRRVLPGVACA